ncbi:MAG: SDR family oxidoreductase [Rhodospirillales bacterium]|jgi:NAD(P)-dependent dehydrogenase (short-subunit alcohol dehydrogenase family)|nr:SDR family oxidoreductase [Rhodospirillales bacterium]MDP6883698.1 SDR family oxidoreductase [Rhodospirillales bacterium]
MSDLDGKVVLVTGASRGIGAAIARALGAAGADVILHYSRGRDAAEAIAGQLQQTGCHLVQGDFECDDDVEKVWRDAVAWKGHVDVLINNAGVYAMGGVDEDFEIWTGVWRRLLQVNLVAAAHLCRHAVLHFRSRGGGIIVNIASRAAFRGDTPDYMQYAASKGGLVSLTRSLARGFAADNILAYVIAPGFVQTDMADDFTRIHGEEAVTRETPWEKWLHPRM